MKVLLEFYLNTLFKAYFCMKLQAFMVKEKV